MVLTTKAYYGHLFLSEIQLLLVESKLRIYPRSFTAEFVSEFELRKILLMTSKNCIKFKIKLESDQMLSFF